MRYVIVVLAVIAGLALVVLLVGWSLPVRHQVSRTVTTAGSVDSVYALVSNVGAYPDWRGGVERVEILAEDSSGRPLRFREHGDDGSILYEVVERQEGRRLVTRIADRSLPFGGRWIYDVSPANDGATLRITEEGEVYNPVFRFVSRFVMGHTRTVDRYLRDVVRRLGGSGTISG